MSILEIRKVLARAFDGTELSAFSFDYFRRVYDKFAPGMRNDDKITLLLDHCRRHPAGFEKLLDVVRQEYDISNPKREELSALIDTLEAYTGSSLDIPDTTKDGARSRSGHNYDSRLTDEKPKERKTMTTPEDIPVGHSYRLIESPQPDYSKIELNPRIGSLSQMESEVIEAIVKVSEKDYLPPGIKVRTRISPYIFTADFLASALEELQKDPSVVSISLSRGLRSFSFRERRELVEHLLAIPSLADHQGRGIVISWLCPEIKMNIARHLGDRIDVLNILNTCLQYPGGIQELRNILRLLEGNSIPMQRFEEALNRLSARG